MTKIDLNLGRSEFGNPENAGNVLSENEAFELLNSWVKNEKLIVHMRQVAHLMKSFARKKRL